MDSQGVAAVVRQATAADASAMRRVALASKAHWGYPDDVLDRFDATLQLDEGYVIAHIAFLAEAGTAIVGFYGVEKRLPVAWLEDLWVLPGWIGKGLGRLLFEHAANSALASGAERLEWEADINAVPFYERMGGVFERWSGTTEFGRRLPIMSVELTHRRSDGLTQR